MKSKKVITVLLAMLTVTVFSGGCSRKNQVVSIEDDTVKPKVNLTFFGNKYEALNVTVIEEILNEFMAENPEIKITYESLKGREYFEALDKRMESGQGDDIIMVNHDTVLSLAGKGMLMDLSDLACIPSFSDLARSQMDEGGAVYFVPTSISAFGLYCNLDLLRKHKQEVPENLEEWTAVCDYFVEQGITPIIANNDISIKTLAMAISLYPVYEEKREREVFSAVNERKEQLSTYLEPGFALVQDFCEKGYIDASKALVTEKTSDDLKEFAKGEAPFMLTGAWAADRVLSMEPDFSFQVYPYPAQPDGTVLVMNADTRISVNAGSAYPEEARRFVEFFMQKENVMRFAQSQCSFSPLKGADVTETSLIAPLHANLENGRSMIGADSLLKVPVWDITADSSKQLLSGETVEKVMDDLEEAVKASLQGA